MAGRRLAALAALAIVSASGIARAHPLVDDGTRAIERARFGEAIEIFDRAAAADDLTTEDLVTMLEGRALAHRAMGDADAAGADLERLAAIRPDHEFARHVPPEIAQSFRSVRDRRAGPLRARVVVDREGDRATVRVSLQGDPGGLVRATRVSARPTGGEWVEGEGEVSIDARAGVEIHVEVIALGGARVIEEGSRDAPLPILVSGRSSDVPIVVPTAGAQEQGSDATPWIALGIGGLLLAGALAGVAIGIAASQPSDLTSISPPHLAAPLVIATFR